MNDQNEQDAPSDSIGEGGTTRREMLRRVVGVAMATALPGCTIAEVFTDGSSAEDINFSLSDPEFAPLLNIGGMVPVNSGPLKIILVRSAEAEVIALDRICTHTACDMSPDEWGAWLNDQLVCGCHGSFFAKDGTRVSGPATRDLNSYPVELDFPNQVGVIRVPNGSVESELNVEDA